MDKTLVTKLTVDRFRLYRSLRDLGRVGAYEDEAAGVTGVQRLALTEADAAGRRLVMEWMREAGLDVRVDAIGNVFAERKGSDPGLAPVMIGSHVDSVPTAGAFDGALGVLGGLEVVRTLDDHGLETLRPLVVAFFTEEEGCRFGTDMLGSAVATERIPLEEAYAITDRDGISVRDALADIDFLGDAPVGGRRPHAYVECHIEQGPVLARTDLEIGVVTGVQAISWWELSLTGRSAHAGTTPTEYRRDAGLTAARINVALRDLVDSGSFGELRATVGVVRPHPGAVNVIPGRVVQTVDLRHPDDMRMEQAERALHELCKARQREDRVEINLRQTAKTAAVPFDESVQEIVAAAASARGLRHERILSGAGHDAQEWARVAKTAMVFVPGEHDGISHNPRELSTEKQCGDGVDVLLSTVLALADES